MQTVKMDNENLPLFLEALKNGGCLWAPVERRKKFFLLSRLMMSLRHVLTP